MATTKNITMKQFNGTDYDTLYPKTVASQVDGVYSEQEVLANDTKTLYGLNNSSTPNDVFKKIDSNIKSVESKIPKTTTELSKIGDIIFTTRTDLGNKWLLCNGSALSTTNYPDLAKLIRGISSKKISSAGGYVRDIACYNGTWVAVGEREGGTNSTPYIYTTTNPTGTWTSKQVSTTTGEYLQSIACYNGTWVAFGKKFAKDQCFVYTTTNPTGTWTKTIVSSSAGTAIKIACYNGTWVAVSNNGESMYIYTTTNPNGTWSLGNSYRGQATDIACYNGTWIITQDSSIYITTNLAGGWTEQSLPTTNISCRSIACHNGTWVIAGYNEDNNLPYIYTTTNPTGTWTSKQVSTIACRLQDVEYCSGAWVVVGYDSTTNETPYIYITTSLTGTWVGQELHTTEKIRLNSVACYNDIWTAVGDNFDSGVFAFSNSYYLLPAISPNRAYAYIKALE